MTPKDWKRCLRTEALQSTGVLRLSVGKIVRRIIGKEVMVVAGEKVQEAVGALQLCAGWELSLQFTQCAVQ